MNAGQEFGYQLVESWLSNKKAKQILRICGEPGTGKTHFIVEMIKRLRLLKNQYLVMSYTGQACSNLIQRGINAKTIHSSILEQYLTAKTINGVPVQYGGIPVMKSDFRRMDYIPPTVILLIIDEASFLPGWLEDMLIMYGVKILEIGDYDQLPPVNGSQAFRADNVDYTFTEPMRQDIDSQIYKLTMDIRRNKVKDYSDYEGSEVTIIRDKDPLDQIIKKHEQLLKFSNIFITTSNKQRQIITDIGRKLFYNTDDPKPQYGERLVCRKNNWNIRIGEHNEYPLVNGTLCNLIRGITRSNISYKDQTYIADLQPIFIPHDYFDDVLCDLNFLRQPFGEKIIDKFNPGNKLEYGLAITTHLSQGAQFPVVVYTGKFFHSQEMTRRIHHVATSRATKHLIWINPD